MITLANLTTVFHATQEGRDAIDPNDWTQVHPTDSITWTFSPACPVNAPSLGVVIVSDPANPAHPLSGVFGTAPGTAPTMDPNPLDEFGIHEAQADPAIVAWQRYEAQRRFNSRFKKNEPHPAWVVKLCNILDERFGEGRPDTPEYLIGVNWEVGHSPDEAAQDIGEALGLVALGGKEGWTSEGEES